MKDFIQQNATSITSIDPMDTNFSDLSTLEQTIGNARIVMLGEQDHGDALTFSAKTRLVKYLHEKLHFNVLAFESDFFALNQGWSALQKAPDSIRSFLKANLLHLWSECESCSELLYHYIPYSFSTNQPLQVSGFDNQLFLQYSLKRLPAALDTFVRNNNFEISRTEEYDTRIKPMLDSLILKRWLNAYYHKNIPDSTFKQTDNLLTQLRLQALGKYGASNFWIKVLENMITENKMFAVFNKYPSANEIRDAQMAANLEWLLNVKYKGEKIIVWAANEHVQKNADKYNSMGYVLANRLLKTGDVFNIGFTSFSGESGRLGGSQYKISLPPTNSAESWLSSKNYAFVDYKAYNFKSPTSHEPFYQRNTVYKSEKKEWNTIYDGLFFIRQMEPCKRIGNN